MKTFIGTALAAVLFLSAVSPGTAPAPLMRILIRPGAMSETVGKGEVDVTMTIPVVNVAAGAPLLSLSTMVPGASKPQRVSGLTVTDAMGPVPVESRNVGGNRQWSSTRAVNGELVVRYRVPVENTPMTQGGRRSHRESTATASPASAACSLCRPRSKPRIVWRSTGICPPWARALLPCPAMAMGMWSFPPAESHA